MISKVKFHPMFKPAMQLAFGKTLICRNMETASQFSKSANLDCVTMEGQYFNACLATLLYFLFRCLKSTQKICYCCDVYLIGLVWMWIQIPEI